MTGKKIADLTGLQFGRLSVVSFSRREIHQKGTRIHWTCVCECGREVERLSNKLKMRRAKSCGTCAKPGGNRIDWPGYSSLKGAIGRCFNTNDASYADYGGRGIVVCDRWRFGEGGKTGFECFFEDMGARPPNLSLDRIKVDGNYEPGNCRWATKHVQQQNQRDAIYANIGGVDVPLKAYAAKVGLCYETIRRKVRKHGMTVQEAARDTIRRVGADSLRPSRGF